MLLVLQSDFSFTQQVYWETLSASSPHTWIYPCFPALTSAALQEHVPFSPVLFQKRSGSYTAVQPSLSLPPPLDFPDQGYLFIPCLISSSFCFSLQRGGVLPRGSISRYPSVANCGPMSFLASVSREVCLGDGEGGAEKS